MIVHNGSDDPIKVTTFHDGQPHVEVPLVTGNRVDISARITNGNHLLQLLLAADAYRRDGVEKVNLSISYLLGARMDRRIGPGHPFTLKVITDLLRQAFNRIRVLDPHSDVSCALLDGEAVLATSWVHNVVDSLPLDVTLCAPDAGALKRVETIAGAIGKDDVIPCFKHRDMATGKLSGFSVGREKVPERVLIVDDICDGGRTFSGTSEVLRAKGAKWVGLYVTHGIFSNGFIIPGIDQIFTTDSYRDAETITNKNVVVLPVGRF